MLGPRPTSQTGQREVEKAGLFPGNQDPGLLSSHTILKLAIIPI